MLYRFKIDLSDIDRALYTTLDFRVAQHPSENGHYLLSRTLAMALSSQEHLEFSPAGLGDPDGPALQCLSPQGNYDLWVEIGNPSAKKIHKASKVANQVAIYTYKKPELLLKELQSEPIHRAQDLLIYAIDPIFLSELETYLEKNNSWTLMHHQGELHWSSGPHSLSTQIQTLIL